MPVRLDPTSSAPLATSVPRQPLSVPRTRAAAVWTGLGVAALVLALLVVFMLQNTAPVAVAFLGMHGAAPLALMLLIAGVAVTVAALTIGFLHSDELRRRRAGARRPVAAPALRRAL